MPRTERDSLGEMSLPDEVYYGVQTARALKNFPVSGTTARPELIEAHVKLKKASALANMDLGELERHRGEAIVKAADEVLSGGLSDQFPVDVYQAGAGTSFNMNVNEVLANRALEILGKQKGDYASISPNDHVNKAQSSNDTYPSASHIAVIMATDRFLPALEDLSKAFIRKGAGWEHVVKSGRTHLMDAMPLTLGDEFKAYGASLQRAAVRLSQRRDDLLELPIGGTATGTGINAHPKFRENVLKHLSDICSLNFVPAKDSFEALQSRSQLAAFSSSLKELAIELIRIANDLRLLGSGPTTGLAEIELPPVQPGSSIMPGKVNPVMAECLDMVAFQVVGNDQTVTMAATAAQLDLNVMTPVMTHNILHSLNILTNYLPVFQSRCVEGILAKEERCRSYVDLNPSLATLLSPVIGYLKAAEVAKESMQRGIPVMELVVEKGLMTKEEAQAFFDAKKIAKSKY